MRKMRKNNLFFAVRLSESRGKYSVRGDLFACFHAHWGEWWRKSEGPSKWKIGAHWPTGTGRGDGRFLVRCAIFPWVGAPGGGILINNNKNNFPKKLDFCRILLFSAWRIPSGFCARAYENRRLLKLFCAETSSARAFSGHFGDFLEQLLEVS